MASNVYVNVIARTSGFTRGMQNAQKALRGFQVTVGKTYNTLRNLSMMLIGAGGVTYGVKKMLDAAAETETVLNKFNVVFGDQAAATQAWAKEFSRNMALAQTDTLKFLASVQDLLVPLGMGRDKATELSKIAVRAATDLARFTEGRTPAEALNAMTGAIMGETEALKSFGVKLDETQLKTEALTLGFKENFKELHPSIQALARFSAILRLAHDAMGATERQWFTNNVQVALMKANISDLTDNLGQVFLPTATFAVSELNKELTASNDSTANLASQAERFGLAVIDIAEKIGIVIATVMDLVKGLYLGLKALIYRIIGWIGKIASIIPGIVGDIGKEVGSEFLKEADEISKAADAATKSAFTLQGIDRVEEWAAGARKRFLEQQAARRDAQAGGAGGDRENDLADRLRAQLQGMADAMRGMFPSTGAGAKSKTGALASIGMAGVREIDSPFMSVSGLSIGHNPIVNNLQAVVAEQRETNTLLRRLHRDGGYE